MPKYTDAEKMQAITEIENYMREKNIPPILKVYAQDISFFNTEKFTHNDNGISIIGCKIFDFQSLVRCSSLKIVKNFLSKKHNYEEEEVVYYYITKKLKIVLFRRCSKAWKATLDELSESQGIRAEFDQDFQDFEAKTYKHSQESEDEMDAEVKNLYSAHEKNLI